MFGLGAEHCQKKKRTQTGAMVLMMQTLISD